MTAAPALSRLPRPRSARRGVGGARRLRRDARSVLLGRARGGRGRGRAHRAGAAHRQPADQHGRRADHLRAPARPARRNHRPGIDPGRLARRSARRGPVGREGALPARSGRTRSSTGACRSSGSPRATTPAPRPSSTTCAASGRGRRRCSCCTTCADPTSSPPPTSGSSAPPSRRSRSPTTDGGRARRPRRALAALPVLRRRPALGARHPAPTPRSLT